MHVCHFNVVRTKSVSVSQIEHNKKSVHENTAALLHLATTALQFLSTLLTSTYKDIYGRKQVLRTLMHTKKVNYWPPPLFYMNL